MMNIYSTVPEKNMKDKPIDRNRILIYLKAIPNKFVTAKTIGQDCNLPTANSQVRIREAITKLIELDNQPIVSCGKGFAYTNNLERVAACYVSIKARIKGLERRLEAYNKIMEY